MNPDIKDEILNEVAKVLSGFKTTREVRLKSMFERIGDSCTHLQERLSLVKSQHIAKQAFDHLVELSAMGVANEAKWCIWALGIFGLNRGNGKSLSRMGQKVRKSTALIKNNIRVEYERLSKGCRIKIGYSSNNSHSTAVSNPPQLH